MIKNRALDMATGSTHNTNSSGMLEIIEYIDKSNVTVRFFNTGSVRSTETRAIRAGWVRDKHSPSTYGVGFIGTGPFKATNKGSRNTTKEYKAWKSMLCRCYDSKYQDKYPTYKGCYVCDEWHNFQNFALWYSENYPKVGAGYVLDKDIKIKGNKVYSPNSCMIVTQKENVRASIAKTYEFIDPTGELVAVNNLRKFSIENNLNPASMYQVNSGKIKSHKAWRLNND